MDEISLLDIIVPVLNGGKYISEALDSLLKQTLENFHIIIVDDGSIDNTYDIIRDYEQKNPEKIKIIKHDCNKGLSTARNNGVKFSNSQYIAFHDCDDISCENKYEKIIKHIENNDLDGCGCLGSYFRESPDNVCGNPGISYEYNDIFHNFHLKNHFIVSSMVLKREVFSSLSGFNCELKGCQDYDLWARCLMAGYKLENVPEVLHYIRLHDDSMCKTLNVVMAEEEKRIRNQYRFFLRQWKLTKRFDTFDLNTYIYIRRDKNIMRTNKKLNIGLILIATNKYIDFFKPLYDSAKNFFLTNHNVRFYLFTNHKHNFFYEDVSPIFIEHQPWPFMTLLRYNFIWKNKNIFSNMDYLFYSDVDMKFVHDIQDHEILSDLVAVIHPGFYNKSPKKFPLEKNFNSTAFIMDKRTVKMYYAGGFQGGKRDTYLRACKILSENINKDLKKNIIAVWHDETHWNKYLIENCPTKILSPSYCYPETGYTYLSGLTKKIIAVNKNHQEIRK